MRRLILFAASCTCIGGLHTAAAQVPSLAEQWQAKAATRAPQSGSAVRQEAFARLSARLHQALISRAAAKPTTSPAAVLPGWRIRRDGSNGTPTFMTAPPATGKVAAVEIADPGAVACFEPNDKGRWQADLYGLARRVLEGGGVTSIYGGGVCTYTESERFFSHRREAPCGRMATLVWLDP